MGSTFDQRADAVAATQLPRRWRRQGRPVVFAPALRHPGGVDFDPLLELCSSRYSEHRGVELPPRHLGVAPAPCASSVHQVSSRPDAAAGTAPFPGSLRDPRPTARRHDPSTPA